jgi:hypothetical protein
MSVSRRKFIRSGALTVMAAGLIFKAGESVFGQKKAPKRRLSKFDVPSEAQQNPILYYERATFEPYVGGTFFGRDSRGGEIELKLLRVTEFKPTPGTITKGKSRDTESFSLTFNASSSLPPFTSIHVIEHPVLGKFDLFLQPVGDPSQLLYQAVITHLL